MLNTPAPGLAGHVGPVFVAVAIVLLSCCIASFYDVVFPYHFMQPETPWTTFVAALLWTGYLVTMMTFHCKLLSTLGPLCHYKAITVKPGSPLDPPRPLTRTWSSFVPASLCFGPFKPRSSTTCSKADQRKAKVVKQIQKQQQQQQQSPVDGPGTLRESRGRTCKKCLPVDGVRPPKPGLHNERYFILFLCYFSTACTFAAWWGWKPMWLAFDFGAWPHQTPRMLVPMTFILAVILGFAVAIMAVYQLWLIACGETTVEAHDNEWYRKTAEIRGTRFLNPYDLGKLKNVQYFFNLEPVGQHHWVTVLLPVSVPAASDGWQWAKRSDWQQYSMRLQDELTDEELASDGEEISS
ncbi:hypothetical protein OIO90_004897 [Microbotryomycetes sp. JL221]|nr:hypothetical protein OIO90_004897 [Microbotryomycetes sp. JL221]